MPRRIPAFGDLEGIRVLRSFDESMALREHASQARHAVVVGAGFIGCEVAASLRSLDATRRALRNTTAPARRRLLPVLVPAGAMLAAALTLAVVWRPPHAPTASAPVPTAAALVAGADGHELEMAQNLDFYAWLANQPAPANGGSVQ